MVGYAARQSTYVDGDVIDAADSNDEFDAILAAFGSASGHNHDGTGGEGARITVVGTADDNVTFGSALTPDANNTIDIGTSAAQFKDLYIDGTAYLDAIDFNGTAISSTAAELNIVDGGTAATSTTLADADRVVVNDNGTMVQVALTDFETYFESALDTLSNVTTVGALNAGSITSGFGAIDNGSSAITTTGTVTYGNLSDGSITITAFVDEDDMSSNSATLVPTQQSVKAYVDSQASASLTPTNKTLTTPIIAEIDNASDITLDAGGDIILDADGANIVFKDGGTSILDIANNSSDVELTVSTADKNFAIKGTDGSSAITAFDIDMALNGKATFSGDVVVTGDLTVSGDDITMGTNTAGHVMVADGTNFNPVAVSGDVTINSAGAVTIANNAVETAMVNANVITGQTAETSIDNSNDTLLMHDNSASALRKITIASLSTALTGLFDVIGDASPQLGGDLDVNGNSIVSVSNGNISILPNGSGKVNIDGNGSSGGVSITDGLVDIRTGTGSRSQIKFYCESSNAHAQTLQPQPHSASVTNTLTLPAGGDQELVGTSATQTLTNKTFDANGTGNSLSNVEVADFAAASIVTESEGIGSNDNDTTLPTSAAVKDYVDTQITAEDLDITTDSGTIAIDLDSETLTVSGGTGIDSSATGNAVTVAIDSTVATLAGSQTLTNKTLTTPIVNAGLQLKNGSTSAGFLEFFEDSDNGTNKATLIGPASTADVTLTLPTATGTIATTDDATALAIALG